MLNFVQSDFSLQRFNSLGLLFKNYISISISMFIWKKYHNQLQSTTITKNPDLVKLNLKISLDIKNATKSNLALIACIAKQK